MTTTDYKTKSKAELYSELASLVKEQLNLRIQRSVGQSNQTHHFKRIRRNIARIKTILGEKEGSLA